MCSSFSVADWHAADDRLSVVMLDLSGSTGALLDGGGTVLSYMKHFCTTLAPVISQGRSIVIGCSSRCGQGHCLGRSVCDCAESRHTRVLFKSDGFCDPLEISRAIEPLTSRGQTFVAATIAALPSLVLGEVELHQRLRVHRQARAFMMAKHMRVGASSPAHCLPWELVHHITHMIGAGAVHARVFLVLDGDNNVACGKSECSACGKKPDVTWSGPAPVAPAPVAPAPVASAPVAPLQSSPVISRFSLPSLQELEKLSTGKAQRNWIPCQCPSATDGGANSRSCR